MNIPTTYTIGDDCPLSLDYPEGADATSSLVLALALVGGDVGDVAQIHATNDGAAFALNLNTTELDAAGLWDVRAVVTTDGKRTTIELGTLRVLPNPMTPIPISQNQRILNAINAQIEGRATDGEQQITIGDRSIGLIPIVDLIGFRKTYLGLVTQERNEALAMRGIAPPRKVSHVAFRF